MKRASAMYRILFGMRFLALLGLFAHSVSAQPTANAVRGEEAPAQRWIGEVPLCELDNCSIEIVSTETPNEPDPLMSEGWVGPYTTGRFTLRYVGSEGDDLEVVTKVQIDNVTRDLLVAGVPVTTLGEVFPNLPQMDCVDAELWMELDLPVVPRISCDPFRPLDPAYVTDSYTPVKTKDDGWPGFPDWTQQQADAAVASFSVTQTAPPADSYDCHGFAFTNGDKWIDSPEVQKIIDDNGYTEVTQVQVGDLALYKVNGVIKHTGVVTAVDENGNPTEIESKWGRAGLYKHAPADVPGIYGNPAYYHTDRANGHLLKKRWVVLEVIGGEIIWWLLLKFAI